MFKDDDEIADLLEDPRNLIKREYARPRRQLTDLSERKQERVDVDEETSSAIAPLHNGGRRPGDNNLSPEMRGLVGAVSQLDTLANTAEAFGVSSHHVHELRHGKHSNAQGVNDKLQDDIETRIAKPRDTALDKLVLTLNEITPEKIRAVGSAKKCVEVASGLSSIVSRLTPGLGKGNKGDDGTEPVKLIVFAPRFKDEDQYKTVTLNAVPVKSKQA